MAKSRPKAYRKKRDVYDILLKLNNYISQRFGIPAALIGSDCDLSQSAPPVKQAPPTLLTPAQAAGVLGISVKTLANWRVTGTSGLPHISVGSRIRYRSSDIDKFITQSAKASTSDKGGNNHG